MRKPTTCASSRRGKRIARLKGEESLSFFLELAKSWLSSLGEKELEESGSKQEAQDKDSILAHASSETDSEKVESNSSGSESLETASTSTPKSESEKSEVSAGRVPTLSEVMDGSTIGTRI
jgi:hypothetical protein